MLLPEPVIDLLLGLAVLPRRALFELDPDDLALVRIPVSVQL